MNSLEFIDGCYVTSPRKVGWFARLFPSLAFHVRFVWIVLRAARKAVRGKYTDQEWVNSSLEVLRALETVGVQFEITGIKHLRDIDGPCLVIGNHMSSLETGVLPCLVQPIKPVTFVVKQGLLRYPIFRHVMASRDPVPVTQTDPRQDLRAMLTGGAERLQRGISLIIFPEGERSPRFSPQRFNSIGVKLAGREEVPIVPVALLTDAWALGKPIGDFGRIDPSRKVHFAFGPALCVTGRGNEAQQQIVDFIQAKLDEWTA